MYVITAYFTDPANVCAGTRPSSSYLGDRLLIQTGAKPSDNVRIPFKEDDLAGSKWVLGKCFYTMGKYLLLFYYLGLLFSCLSEYAMRTEDA